jgi:gamma-glutamylcyclotransferase (GGCT)/AIG2-like uncharacterized protein YtfP
MKTPRLFVYGTLMNDDLVRYLAGRPLPWRPAVLEGYCRTLDSSIGYPVVHPLAGASVDGRILEEIDEQMLTAVDTYEGDLYRRVVVRVQTSDGRNVDAYMYVPRQPLPSATREP